MGNYVSEVDLEDGQFMRCGVDVWDLAAAVAVSDEGDDLYTVTFPFWRKEGLMTLNVVCNADLVVAWKNLRKK